MQCPIYPCFCRQQQMLNAVVLPPLAMVRHPDYQEAPTFFDLFDKFDVETRKLTMEHIASLLQKFVDKELLDKAPVHRMLKIYTRLANEEQINAVLQMTVEGFLRLASTKDGVDAMVRLLGYATAKQRKAIVKEMKKVMVSMTTNPVDYLLVLRLLCTVDDTKLLRDVLIKVRAEAGSHRPLFVTCHGDDSFSSFQRASH
uniref:Uncharacterized protein n=1 Tax=Toxoplasma gondii TgCATBr9 TaxID=943120 RepID=A0A2T6J1M4_TOXGO|nr:hypothetical protein TGBR9_314480B [Toxoplasma gondii TgCATBr9]